MKFFKALGLVALLGFAAIGVLAVVGRKVPFPSTYVPASPTVVVPTEDETTVVKSPVITEVITEYNEVTGDTTVRLPVIRLDSQFMVQAGYYFEGKTPKRPDEVFIHLGHRGNERRWGRANTVYLAQGEIRANYEVLNRTSNEEFESVDAWMSPSSFQQIVDGDRLLIQVENDTLTVSGEHLKAFKKLSSEIPNNY